MRETPRVQLDTVLVRLEAAWRCRRTCTGITSGTGCRDGERGAMSLERLILILVLATLGIAVAMMVDAALEGGSGRGGR